jgi:hypothetical protein
MKRIIGFVNLFIALLMVFGMKEVIVNGYACSWLVVLVIGASGVGTCGLSQIFNWEEDANE